MRQILQFFAYLDGFSWLHKLSFIGARTRNSAEVIFELWRFSSHVVWRGGLNNFAIAFCVVILSRTYTITHIRWIVSWSLREGPTRSLFFSIWTIFIISWTRCFRHDQRIPKIFANNTSNMRKHFFFRLITARTWNLSKITIFVRVSVDNKPWAESIARLLLRAILEHSFFMIIWTRPRIFAIIVLWPHLFPKIMTSFSCSNVWLVFILTRTRKRFTFLSKFSSHTTSMIFYLKEGDFYLL